MNGMLDFICMGPVELQGTRNKRKLQNYYLQWDLNPRPVWSPAYESIANSQISIDMNEENKVYFMPVNMYMIYR